MTQEGAEMWATWMPVLETGCSNVTEAMLDAARVTAGSKLIDLACGVGTATVAGARRGAQTTGLDLNHFMLERADQSAGVTYVQGDMATPPAGPWDAIVSRFGAHHAPPEWLTAATRVLAPGGIIAIAEWHPDTALFDLEAEGTMATEDTAEVWIERLTAAGLEDVRSIEVTFVIDFGTEKVFQNFLNIMADGHVSKLGAPDGKQPNRAFIVSGRRA